MKCPICGKENTLEIYFLYQYSKVYKITKKGLLAKKYKKEDNGTEEASVLICKNGCDVNDLEWDWDCETRKLTIEEKSRWNLR